MLASARVTAAEQLDERPDAASLRDREPVRVVVREGEKGTGGLLLGRVPTRAVEQTDEVGDGARLMREAIKSQKRSSRGGGWRPPDEGGNQSPSRGHQGEEDPRLYPAGNQLDEGGNQLGTWAMSAAVC
jgi:hypothetical protein